MKTKHLNYCILTAHLGCQEYRHPEEMMFLLGIKYQDATPQSIGDCWWFWNCENIPNELPKYLTYKELNPMKCIGYGLSKEQAEKIRDYEII